MAVKRVCSRLFKEPVFFYGRLWIGGNTGRLNTIKCFCNVLVLFCQIQESFLQQCWVCASFIRVFPARRSPYFVARSSQFFRFVYTDIKNLYGMFWQGKPQEPELSVLFSEKRPSVSQELRKMCNQTPQSITVPAQVTLETLRTTLHCHFAGKEASGMTVTFRFGHTDNGNHTAMTWGSLKTLVWPCLWSCPRGGGLLLSHV